MKKLLILTLFAITALSACKKDSPSPNSNLIVGKWEQNHLTIEYIPEVSPQEDYNIPPGYIVDFQADGKVYVTDGQAAPAYNGDWSMQDNSLQYGAETYTIEQLTSTQLVYSIEATYPDHKTITTYTFTKK